MVGMDVREARDPANVEPFRAISRQVRSLLQSGKFCAEGEQVVQRLLESQVPMETMLITPEYQDRWKNLLNRVEQTIWIAEKSWMELHTDQKLNQACLAIGRIPHIQSAKDFCRSTRCRFVALDRMDHAVNAGAIIRNCAAFEVTALISDKRSVHPYSLRTIRASLGGVFQVPICVEDSLVITLGELKDQGVQLIVADPAGPVSLQQVDFSNSCCLILGNEHGGVSNEIRDLSAVRVRIPISTRMDSLNVASASAIFLQQMYQKRLEI